MSKVEEVRGTLVVLRFEAAKCIHSRGCVLARPDVFVPNVVGEWIHPDAATPEEIAELAHSCPSGAITYERLDGGPQEAPPKVNLIRIRENGPLAVHAELTIAGHGAMPRATLCRCGHSKTKPFAHRRRVRRVRRARDPSLRAPRRPQRPGHDHARREWPAAGVRLRGAGVRHRPHARPLREGRAVPVRPFGEQAVLRRHAPQGRVRRPGPRSGVTVRRPRAGRSAA